jgi:hypothetical protein
MQGKSADKNGVSFWQRICPFWAIRLQPGLRAKRGAFPFPPADAAAYPVENKGLEKTLSHGGMQGCGWKWKLPFTALSVDGCVNMRKYCVSF